MRPLNCNEIERALGHEDDATKYTIEKKIKETIKKCRITCEQSEHVQIVRIPGYPMNKEPPIVSTKRRIEMLGDSVSVDMFKYILLNFGKLFSFQ